MRTFLINVAVFLGLSTTAYFAIPVVDLIGKGSRLLIRRTPETALLPNYAGQEWAKKHFAELRDIQTQYVSFLGWRHLPYAGETVTIERPLNIRKTPQNVPAAVDRSGYFFGGSTMWGVGADDARTIPALFQRIAGGHVLNFGEFGWNAHQSLNQLMKLYTEGHRPNLVIFYDGFNDVRLKCRTGKDFWADEREARIREAVAYRPFEAGYFVQPLLYGAAQLRARTKGKDSDCDSDPRKAELVAEQLISDWKIAAMLVASYGGRFHAYLQPVVFFSRTRVDHLRPSQNLRRQFETVYRLVRQKTAGLEFFTDLTDVLDHDEYIYLDACHLSPNGNALVAARIAADLK
jgi:hypothetical protein